MKAITQDRYGSADVLKVEEVPKPEPDDDEILVQVRAAGVGPEVWHIMTGLPYLVRLMGVGLRAPKQRIPGRDLAGTVEAVGRNVNAFKPGDEVYGAGQGTLAEYAIATDDSEGKVGGRGVLALKPANLTFAQAAAVPTSGSTALQGLRAGGGVTEGQSVLIIGASGGVGTFAVQLAKHYGARVTGVCSAAKAELVQSLGADTVIDYTKEEFTDRPERYDFILDTAGRRPIKRLRRALETDGTLVIVGGEGGGRLTGGLERQLSTLVISRFVSQRLVPLTAVDRRADLDDLTEIIESGALTPVVDRTFELSDTASALSDSEEGHGRGKKVVLTHGEPPPAQGP
jgi:NADPH:quinone reductase-like Zn-dependent oxidoreductase